MYKIVCLKCKKEFETQDKRRKFCSLKCANDYNRSVVVQKRIYKKCLTCKKDFYSKDKNSQFCGSSCSARYNNILRGKRTKEGKTKISESVRRYHSLNKMSDDTKRKISFSLFEYHENKAGAILDNNQNTDGIRPENIIRHKKCKYCKKDFVPDKSFRCYCSFDCYNNSRGGKTKNEISYRTFYKMLKRIFPNWSCPFCGWSYSFSVHHINGRKDNDFNSLVMLCPNHHSLAHLGKIPTEDMKIHSIGSKCSKEEILKSYKGKSKNLNINFHKYKMHKEAMIKAREDRSFVKLYFGHLFLGDGI